MTVMTAKVMARDSYVSIYSVTSSGGTTAVTDIRSGGQPVFRASGGGTTITSSSEATVAVPICDNIGFLVSYAGSSGSTSVKTVTIYAGDDGWRSGVGNVSFGVNSSASTTADLKRWLAGPFETARFAFTSTSTSYGKANSNYVKVGFATAGAATAGEQQYVNVTAFKWPGVSYAT